MALHPHVVRIAPIITTVKTLAQYRAAVNGDLDQVYIKSDTNATGNITFDVEKNGVSIYANPLNRPVVLNGASSISQTGLDFAVLRGDLITLKAVVVPSLKQIGGALEFHVGIEDNVVGSGPGTMPYEIAVAVSDEITPITVGTAKLIFHVDTAFDLSSIFAGLSTISSSGLPQINIKKNGTTIFTTNLTIDASEKTSLTSITPYVLTGPTSFAIGDEVQIDIVAAGTGATGLKVYFKGVRV